MDTSNLTGKKPATPKAPNSGHCHHGTLTAQGGKQPGSTAAGDGARPIGPGAAGGKTRSFRSRSQIKTRLAISDRPPITLDANPREIWPKLIGPDTSGSDTLHYRAPVSWDWLFSTTHSVHQGAVDLQTASHRGSPTCATTGILEQSNGF